MSDKLDPHTLRAIEEAWWRGRCSANARQGEWAGPELRERCAKDIADLAEAPPETSHAAAVPVSPDRLQWVLDHNMQIRAGHRVQIANAVEAWRRDRADVARLTAERDTARAQVWAEVIRVVEQMLPVAAWTFNMARVAILATLRAQSKRS